MFLTFLRSASAEETSSAKAASPVFKKLLETGPDTWIVLIAIVLLAVVLLTIRKSGRRWNNRMIAFAAISVALSYVLSCIRLYRMPNGGSITPASMLPLMLFSACYGIGPGMIAGLVYGLLQCTQGITFIAGIQFLFDYILAFAMLGLAGLCSGKKDSLGRLMLCLFIAAFCRFLCHTVAGMYWYFGEYETGESFLVKLWASVVYNGSYMLPDLVICLLLAIPVHKPVFRIMKG